MSSHISISCNDVSKLIQEFENSSIRTTIASALKNITDAKKGTLCGAGGSAKDTCGDLGLIADYLCKGNKDCENVITSLQGGCTEFLSKCKPNICGTQSSDNYYDIPYNCSALRKGIDDLLKSKLLQKQDMSREQLCAYVNGVLVSDVIDLLTAKIKDLIKDPKQAAALVDLLNKSHLDDVIKCVCPGVLTAPIKINKHKEGTTSIPKYNIQLVGILALIIAGIFILPFILVAALVKVKAKWIVLGLILFFALLAFTVIMLVNPDCLFKTCPIFSGKLVNAEGTYKGSKSLMGLTVSVNLEVSNTGTKGDSQVITLNTLKCSDGGSGACPASNLLTNCKDKRVMLDKKTDYGYPIIGDCIDELYKYTSSDGNPTIAGIWLAEKGTQILVQLLVHITKPVTLDKFIVVPLTKTS